jgi:transposase
MGMAKRKFTLTKEQNQELKAAYHQCQDGQTKIRYQAVRLYGNGYAIAEIHEITGCSRPSLMEWCRVYRQAGAVGLVDKRQGGNRAKMTVEQLEHLQQQLERYTPRQILGVENCYGKGEFWRIPDLARLLDRDYGINYKSASSYRDVFMRCDFSYQRPGTQYKSRNELQVLDFEQGLEKNS